MLVRERDAVITGIGQSEVGRRVARDPLALTVDACLAAIDDAGLSRSDIDGLSTYPGAAMAGAAGFSGAGVTDVHEALRLQLNWFAGGLELPGQLWRHGLRQILRLLLGPRVHLSLHGSIVGAHHVGLDTFAPALGRHAGCLPAKRIDVESISLHLARGKFAAARNFTHLVGKLIRL